MNLARIIVAAATFFATAVTFPAVALGDEEPEVLALKQGDAAPYSGLLVPQTRMIELLTAEVRAESLAQKLKSEKDYSTALEKMCDESLVTATQPPAWYESPRVVLAVGITLGVLATSAAIYGGTKVVEAAR